MNARNTLAASSLIIASLASGAAHAALQGRDLDGNTATFEAYYDTDLDITWLANANYAKTSGYDADGKMTWTAANTWAANLSFFNPLTNQTYDNWRLPTTLQPDASCGTNVAWSYGAGCTGSEMGHLFYAELGGTAYQSILASADPDLAKFTNLQAYHYWSATELAPGTGIADIAFDFDFGYGSQSLGDVSNRVYALAVSPGDVAAVPEAGTWAMMLAGLGLIGATVRRRTQVRA